MVAVQAIFPTWAVEWCQYSPKGWKRPFAVAACHSEWGARAVQAAGASPLVVNLIRRHMEKKVAADTYEGQLLLLLQEADNES